MRFIFDSLLIIVFFVAYKLWGIYAATTTIMAGSAIQMVYIRLQEHQWNRLTVQLTVVIWILGCATLLFHNPVFIKWKPTVVYWALSCALLSTHCLNKTPLLKKLLGEKISLPDPVWSQINFIWGLFFLTLGAINIYVLYSFSTTVWIYFKLIGCLGLSLVLLIIQAIYLAKHLTHPTS